MCDYWIGGYDFQAAEQQLNRFPQVTVEVAPGMHIHPVHCVGEARGTRPLLMIHGWPGSSYEYWPAIERLEFPSRFGRSAETAFDVVVPSLPGYAFSSKPTKPVGPVQTAT